MNVTHCIIVLLMVAACSAAGDVDDTKTADDKCDAANAAVEAVKHVADLVCGAKDDEETEDECILLIGGSSEAADAPPVEFYHPRHDCPMNRSRLAGAWLNVTKYTSGCYLAESHKGGRARVFDRTEAPVTYTLDDGQFEELPLPYNNSNGFGRIASSNRLPQHTVHSAAAADALGRGCFSCGGLAGRYYLDECFEYVDEAFSWLPMPPMPQHLQNAAAAMLGDYFYVTGGFNRLEQNRVYAVGGLGKFREQLTSVEHYNRTTGEWTVVPRRLSHARAYFVGVAV